LFAEELKKGWLRIQEALNCLCSVCSEYGEDDARTLSKVLNIKFNSINKCWHHLYAMCYTRKDTMVNASATLIGNVSQ
jgi:hypothetical protein